MCNAKFPFGKAGDKYYNKFHQDPESAMEARNISCDPDLLDLIRGMTMADASQRLNMNQIASHDWLQGEKASQEEITQLFYNLNEKAQQAQKQASQ